MLAFGLWVLGLRGGAAPLATRAIGAFLLAGALVWSWPGPALSGVAVAGQTRTVAAEPGSPEAAWMPYDEAAIADRLGQGQPVFVDFTAAWCVSCQVNKRLVLNTDATRQAFAQAGVALMRADWTQRDARITAALARLGATGCRSTCCCARAGNRCCCRRS